MTVADILRVLVDRTDESVDYNARSDDVIPTVEEVANWSARTGLDYADLFDQLGLALARGYDSGNLSFTVCDFIVNDLSVCEALEDLPHHRPETFWSVYDAFDAGEYYHDKERAEDPDEVYTRPMIKTLLSQVEQG